MSKSEQIAKIEERLDPPHPANFYVLPEWEELVIQLDAELSRIDPAYKILQVKEKFGSLRFYYQSSEEIPYEDKEKMRELVFKAENESYRILNENR